MRVAIRALEMKRDLSWNRRSKPWRAGMGLVGRSFDEKDPMRLLVGLLIMAVGLGACGGAAVPQEKLSSAEAAVRAAEVGGAPNDPKAALHVKKAKEAVASAKRLIADGENERAGYVLERAHADAELALAMAQELAMRAEAEAAKQEVQKLQEQSK